MTEPKVLFIDLESLPSLCYAYDLYSPKSPDMILKEKAILTFSWKWLGDKAAKVIVTKEPYNDAEIVERIIAIISEADYVVAHYGDKFDLKFIRSRALVNGLESPPQIVSIDTYKLAKKYFNFNANRLDYLGKLFGFGGKIKMGFKYWRDCAAGDKKALAKMALYNKRDVELLEKVFLKMLPYVESKLNHKLFTDHDGIVCNHCGSENIQKRGTSVNMVTRKQRYHCQSCGSWFTGKYHGS